MPVRSQPDEYVSVVALGGTDFIGHVHVQNLLNTHGIGCVVEGSVIYGVSVRKKDAARAMRILEEDAHRHPYWIGAGQNGKPASEPAWSELTVRKTYASLMAAPDDLQPPELVAVLRHPWIQRCLEASPHVTTIRFLSREHLGPDGGLHTGYDVEIQLTAAKEGRAATSHLFFQVWNGGREVQFTGGSSYSCK